MKLAMISAAGLLMAGGSAVAQTTGPQDAPAPSQNAAPQASDFSSAQVDGFAKAVVEFQSIDADQSMDDQQKQNAKLAVVQQSGLDAPTFNSIAQAAQTDPELNHRVQVAISQQTGAASNQ